MKKQKFLITSLIIFTLTITACSGHTNNIANNETESVESEEITTREFIIENDLTHNLMDNGHYLVAPNYFIQDYADVQINDKCSVKTSGSLLVCLSMIASYINSEELTPDIFAEEYGEYFNENGLCNIESLMNSVITADEAYIEKGSFNPEQASIAISEDEAIVLLEIPHRSIYGENMAYLILTGSQDDYLAIRDPNYTNIEKYSIKDMSTYNGEFLYHYSDVLTSAGLESTMYIFGWRVENYEDE